MAVSSIVDLGWWNLSAMLPENLWANPSC